MVLARRSALSVDMPPLPLSLMAASRQVNHRCFHYLLAWSPHDAFLGSSPERLYHRHGRCLDTEALAGTVACDPDPQQASRQESSFIRRHEPFARQWYAGSAGYLTAGETEFCVALRPGVGSSYLALCRRRYCEGIRCRSRMAGSGK